MEYKSKLIISDFEGTSRYCELSSISERVKCFNFRKQRQNFKNLGFKSFKIIK